METSWTGMVAGAAILGTVLGCIVRGWNSLKTGMGRLVSLLIVTVELRDEVTSNAVLAYLLQHYRRITLGGQAYGGRCEHLRSGKFGHIPYEDFTGRTVGFWSGWMPFFYSPVPSKEDGIKKEQVIYWGDKPKQEQTAVIRYLRGSLNVDAIIRQASVEKNHLMWSTAASHGHTRFFVRKVPDATSGTGVSYRIGSGIAWFHEGVYRLLSHRTEELGLHQPGHGRMLDKLVFPEEIREVLDEIEVWKNNRDWYLEHNIPWKRGMLLYGPPGSGKSAVARAIAEDLDLPLFSFSLGEMLNMDLQRSWTDMLSHTPCIALFEDFDNVFHGRENIFSKPTIDDTISQLQPGGPTSTKTGQLSFDCLLNTIDGVGKEGGVFCIFTTNDVAKIDPALGQPRHLPDGRLEFIGTRPGRIDRVLELGYMRQQEKRIMAERILGDEPDGLRKILDFVERYPDYQETPAQFQERCAQVAIGFFWKRTHRKNSKHRVGK